MIYLLLIGLVIALVYAPAWWVRRIMRRYSQPAERYPSTGAELARHLLDERGLQAVPVEETDRGDHYDPTTRTVRLAPERFHGKSLTAITVAAHEVGHALQHAGGYTPLLWRTRLVQCLQPLERLGALVLLGAPLLAVVLRLPGITLLLILGGLMTLGASTLVHMVTLPTELDASFARAMPLLKHPGILLASDHYHARRILWAAALTYVSVSLMSLLNVARWWALVRR